MNKNKTINIKNKFYLEETQNKNITFLIIVAF